MNFKPESKLLTSAIAQSQLDPYVCQSVMAGKVEGMDGAFLPTESMCAAAAMMRIIRQGGKPRSTVIEATPELAADEVIFTRFASSIAAPAADRRNPAFRQASRHPDIDACNYAELGFASILRGKTLKEKAIKLGPVLAFHEEGNDEPLLIQKFFRIDTALGLKDINIDGIDYPAGTLFSLYSKEGRPLHRKHIKEEKRLGQLAVRHLGIDRIQSLAPVRLTTFALPAAGRPTMPRRLIADMAGEVDPYDWTVYRHSLQLELDDFRRAFTRPQPARRQLLVRPALQPAA